MQFVITTKAVYVGTTQIGSSLDFYFLQPKYLAFTYSGFYSGNEPVCIPLNIELTQIW